MSASDLAQVMEQDHRALDAFVRGDPEPKKKLFSRRDDVTLANPFLARPPAVGTRLRRLLERAASCSERASPSASSASRRMQRRMSRIPWRSSVPG